LVIGIYLVVFEFGSIWICWNHAKYNKYWYYHFNSRHLKYPNYFIL